MFTCLYFVAFLQLVLRRRRPKERERCSCRQGKRSGTEKEIIWLFFVTVRGSRFVKFQELRIQELPEEVPVGHVPRTLAIQVRMFRIDDCLSFFLSTLFFLWFGKKKGISQFKYCSMNLFVVLVIVIWKRAGKQCFSILNCFDNSFYRRWCSLWFEILFFFENRCFCHFHLLFERNSQWESLVILFHWFSRFEKELFAILNCFYNRCLFFLSTLFFFLWFEK